MSYSKSYPAAPLEEDPTTAHRLAHNPLPEAQEDHSKAQRTKPVQNSRSPKMAFFIFALALLLTLYLVSRWLPTLHPAPATIQNPVSDDSATSTAGQLPKPSPTAEHSPAPIPVPTPTTAQQTGKDEVAQLYQSPNNPNLHTQQPETVASPPNATSPPAFSTPTPLSTPANPNRQIATTTTLPETIASNSPNDNRAAENSTASSISQRFEITSLAMQQVDVALFPKATGLTSQALRLNVPIVHEKKLLSLTAGDFTKLREIIAHIQDTRVKQLALQQEISTELNDYNAIIRKGTPEAVLNADSPSLINNSDQQ